MPKTDTRKLSQMTQDELGFRGVQMVKSGMSQAAVARGLVFARGQSADGSCGVFRP